MGKIKGNVANKQKLTGTETIIQYLLSLYSKSIKVEQLRHSGASCIKVQYIYDISMIYL